MKTNPIPQAFEFTFKPSKFSRRTLVWTRYYVEGVSPFESHQSAMEAVVRDYPTACGFRFVVKR